MVLFLTRAPLWISALILLGLGTALSMLGPLVVRRFVALEKIATNNEVAGFKFAAVGVLYAVLLAFAVIVVWQKYADADDSVAKEAAAAATLYHLSVGLNEAQGTAVRAALTNYLQSAIADEWPAMDRGSASKPTWQALQSIYTALIGPEPQPGNTALMSEILYQLDVLTQARRVRLVSAEGAVPDVVWAVLFGGAAVTIVFTFFFGTRNLVAQVLMTGLLAFLIFSELMVAIAIDRPFTGSVKVGPQALEEVLADFAHEQ
jgi:Na+/proline symporter